MANEETNTYNIPFDWDSVLSHVEYEKMELPSDCLSEEEKVLMFSSKSGCNVTSANIDDRFFDSRSGISLGSFLPTIQIKEGISFIGTCPGSAYDSSPRTQSKKGSLTGGSAYDSSSSHKNVIRSTSYMYKILKQIRDIAAPFSRQGHKPSFEAAMLALERIKILCEDGLQGTSPEDR